MSQIATEEIDALDTEDYRAFTAAREGSPVETQDKAPAAGEETTPPSEPAEEEESEAGQTAEESDTEEESTQQEEEGEEGTKGEQTKEPEETEEEEEEPKPKGGRLSRRMRQLSGEIAALKSQLAELGQQPTEDDEEAPGEVASPAEPADEPGEKPLVRPMLKDFEDTDTESAWDQYEKALDEYNDAKSAQKIQAALDKQRNELELKHAKESADAAWSKAASRFSDYNEVVGREGVKISAAMESVMRMDPEAGTELAYFLGNHPEESERIARATLATNEREWTAALARAGMELGKIGAKLAAGKNPPKAEPPKPPAAKPPAAPPQPKKVTSASKPPTTLRGGTQPPKVDPANEDDAADYRKWNKAREAQLKRK